VSAKVAIYEGKEATESLLRKLDFSRLHAETPDHTRQKTVLSMDRGLGMMRD